MDTNFSFYYPLVQVNVEGDYHMEGGPLPSVYQLTQLHFHWGSQEGQGSEHKIDGKQFEAEVSCYTC